MRQTDREKEREIHQVGEGLTKQNFPEAAASELLGYVSGLIKWRFSLLAKQALTELGQNRKGVTSVAFNDAVNFLLLHFEHKTPTSH